MIFLKLLVIRVIIVNCNRSTVHCEKWRFDSAADPAVGISRFRVHGYGFEK